LASYTTYAKIVEHAQATIAGAASTSLPSTSCGHATTFDLTSGDPTFAVAFVKDPVSRFISAINPHGKAGEIDPKRVY